MKDAIDLANEIAKQYPDASREDQAAMFEARKGEITVLQAKALDWAATDKPQEAPRLVTLDSVEPQPPRYFWEPYIRLDNLNVVRGDGGAGKTMFLFALAAAVTTGRQPEGMPGALQCGQGSVIYYGAEDDPGEYANRAALCGCDRRFLHVVSEGSTLPQLSDTETFRQQIKETGAKLIVFDPIQSFLGAGTDMNRANEVRPMLDALRALCREMGVTAVIIEHLNKATQQKAAYRGIGTVDIINASRSTLMIGYHPKEQGMSVALQIKANAKYGEPIKFSIDSDGRFRWRGVCDVTEEDVADARRFKQAVEEAVDPVLALVLALMEKYPGGWTGTTSQMLAEGSALVDCSLITGNNSIGKRLPGIHKELIKRGIRWQKLRREHSFSRQQKATFLEEKPPCTDSCTDSDS